MSEVVLQAIVDKLEAIEIALLKQQTMPIDDEVPRSTLIKLEAFKSELSMIAAKVRISNERLNEIWERLDSYILKRDEHVKNSVTYHLHLNKSLRISLALFICLVVLLITCMNTYNSTKQFEANDIKYRALKMSGGKNLVRLLYYIDSSYNFNPDSLRQTTIQQEDRLAEQTKLLRLAGEKERDAEELKAKAKESR
ncbi:hypothetical protein [Segetibacter aerophilus]|uniref:Uncharacterized protein n=1 Tax=Segetibacter aerophilus TaxID=670293 RepID=A0A512B9Q3_9BACT|nr:hypothetical protein [Segetibacter aerophilus]GEO08696.1 hypothetical protein SAE01_11920 [Segetibacter aerophilus]